MPRAEELLPYLRLIDQNQWYSNFGSLVTRFEARLGQHFGVGPANVTTVANGTLGLVAALQAQNIVPGQFCIVPSFTFAASPAAAISAGLKPYFFDVDRASWALDPATVELAVADGLANVGAVMPVSPFGAPLDVRAWDSFTARTGIPVVLDAAWAFDARDVGLSPAMISLHATKVLGVGEGGLVVSRDPELIAAIKRLSNFGFDDAHQAESPGGNYKMSEYAAAIGHAALDAWPQNHSSILAVARAYRAALSDIPGLRLPGWFGEQAGATCAVELGEPIGPQVVSGLQQHGIEGRLWWGRPCHLHSAYASCERGPLPNTDWLAPRVLCLPFYAEISATDVERVRAALVSII